jgi:extracellular factor (EF) 3-hydroxypalmitic acid methyl ester biosynthesis protein
MSRDPATELLQTDVPIDSVIRERADHYSNLDGASGRDIYFRPERYPRSELGPVGVVVGISMLDGQRDCELHDVSQNGVAFEWPRDIPIEVGAVLEEVVLRFDDHEAYRGRARVSSVRRGEKRLLVGASFVDTLMNIEDVLQLRDVKAWSGESNAKGLAFDDAPWRAEGHERFKAAVSDFRLFLEDAQVRFGELEASLPWHVAHGEEYSPAREALIEQVRTGFTSEAVRTSAEIDDALHGATRSDRDALREYSMRHLHDLLMLSPWMHRALHKPLGYPGDFEVMNGIYARNFSGATLFAKAVNLSFVSTPAAVAVRTRKDLIKRQYNELIDSRPPGARVRILSVAAGPAQEFFELLSERTTLDVELEVVLFDQDKSALAFSYGRLVQLVNTKWRKQVRIVHLHDSIKRLLRGSTVLGESGKFDAVCASGLFDYLQRHTWISLCRSLYGMLAPEGRLLIGNMVPTNPTRWVMEFHLDWFLLYREREELRELALRATNEGEAHVEILEEASGVNPFVALTQR